jgi:hypothetical protein
MTTDELRKAREESANVAYQTFAKHIAQNMDGLFCFYEGKDAPYYSFRIKIHVPERTAYPIICNGKSMVIKVFELIQNHREYDKYRKAFFVDCDFDESITATYGGSIYETPTYSVENFYIHQTCVGEILKNELGIPAPEETYINTMQCFNDRIPELLDAQSLFNSWYCCLREKRLAEGLRTTGVRLEEKFPKGYLTVTLNSVQSNYDLAKIKADFPQAITVADDIVATKQAYIATIDRTTKFRGKYLLDFLHQFLKLIIVDSKAGKNVAKATINYHFELAQMISMYSQYAITPTNLVEYLKKFV